MYSMQDFLLPGAANIRQPRYTNPGTQQNQTAPRTTYRPQQEFYYNPAQRQQPSQHHLNNNMPHPRQVQVIQRQALTNSQQTSQNIMVKYAELFPPIVHGMEAYYTKDYVEMVVSSRIHQTTIMDR